MIVKKIFNQWVYDEKEIIKVLEEKKIEYNESTIINYLLDYVINNKKFRKDVLEKMSKDGELHSLYVYGSYFIENRMLRKINSALHIFPNRYSDNVKIDSGRIIKYLESKKELNQDETIFLEKMKEYLDSNIIIEKILNKKINNNLTYRDLIYFFMKSSEDFDNSIVDDKILGLTLLEAKELLSNRTIKYSFTTFISKMNVTDLMKKNFNINVDKVSNIILQKKEEENTKKEIEEKIQIERDFKPYYGLTNEFELNQKLVDKINSQVPSDFSTLQKAYCIYRLLCQEFTYDEEFFYLQHFVPDKDHTKFSRLSTLKGGEEVVCTVFSLIYAKFLDLLGVPFTTLDYDDDLIMRLADKHIKIRFKIDNYIVDADGAHGLYESDMVTQKTINRVNNFQLVNRDTYDEKDKKELQEVDEYFKSISANNECDHAIDMYRQIYFNQNEEYSKLSFLERLDLVKEIILNSKLKFFDMIQLCSNLKRKIMANYYDKIKIEFIVKKTVNEKEESLIKNNLNILIAYNEFDSLYDDYNSNKYIVITPDRQVEELNYETLKQRFNDSTYNFTKDERNIFDLKEEVVTDGREVISRRASR